MSYKGAGRVGFIANQEAITERFKRGEPLSVIYSDFSDKLGIGYSQFARYVSRYIRSQSEDGIERYKGTKGQAKPPEIKATKKEKVPFFDSKGGHNSDGLI